MQFGKEIVFCEQIAVPCFGGQIIPRFDCLKDDFTLKDIFRIELGIREIVKTEFLVNFVGSVYQRFGLLKPGYEKKFIEGLK